MGNSSRRARRIRVRRARWMVVAMNFAKTQLFGRHSLVPNTKHVGRGGVDGPGYTEVIIALKLSDSTARTPVQDTVDPAPGVSLVSADALDLHHDSAIVGLETAAPVA